MRFLALVLLLLGAQDKAKRKLEWKFAPATVHEYDVVDPKTNKPTGEIFHVFSSELKNRLVVDRYADIPWALIFQLPRDEVKPGQGWEYAGYFFHEAAEATAAFSWGGAGSIRPVHAKARYVLKKIDKKGEDETAQIDGDFELFEIRRDFVNNQLKLTVTKNKMGSGTFSTLFSLTKCVIVQAAFTIDAPRAQERTWDKDSWRVTDRRVKETRRIQFKETLTLDREKMAKAVEAALKKSVDWLKKQQKASGEFPASGETNTTGLALQAMLAAGVKPEEDAAARALKSLRSNPGTRTAHTYANLCSALVARSLPAGPWPDHKLADLRAAFKKDFPDAPLLRSSAEQVLELRDRKAGGWGVGQRAVVNPMTTRHAVETLFDLTLLGPSLSNELVNGILDFFHTLLAEETDTVDLKLEFEEGFRGIEHDGKSVMPATWKFAVSSGSDPMGQGRDSKGTVLTTLAVLDSLAMLRSCVPLSDSQKKSVDTLIKRGLAWIQWTWTLRTPPPAEASWSVQKEEHLHLLSRVLTALGVRTLGGADWYLEGAYVLLRRQNGEGFWDSSGGAPLVDTSRAVLFLSRGALRLPAHN